MRPHLAATAVNHLDVVRPEPGAGRTKHAHLSLVVAFRAQTEVRRPFVLALVARLACSAAARAKNAFFTLELLLD